MAVSYSVRKIPVVQNQDDFTSEINDIDNVRILEISNSIDAWEKELLFSQNGFYSLKGKDVENRTKEFALELEKFIDIKISEQIFQKESSRRLVYEIKQNKIETIKNQMQMYENEQLKIWEFDVYEETMKSTIQRAVLYKNNIKIVQQAYENGIAVLKLMSEREKWKKQTFIARKALYESDFYFELINSFILDKDVNASLYFEKYKEKLMIDEKEKLEEALKIFKINVIAYNWAKELFSYELIDKDNEKEISMIEDKILQNKVRKYINQFKQDKERAKKEDKLNKNEENWKEIISILSSDSDKAELYIDYTLNKESINAKIHYIKIIRKDGCIKTDKGKFLELLALMFDDFDKFKKEEISNLRSIISSEDYELIEKFRTYKSDDYNLFVSDYRYVKSHLENQKVTDEDEIYDFIKFLISVKSNYVSTKKEEPDIETRNKLIKTALERYTTKK